MTATDAEPTHIAERVNGYWNVSRLDDRTQTTSGRPRGWRFITGTNGTSRYLLRMERGMMTARTYKIVAVETHWGRRSIRPSSRLTLTDDTLPESGPVIVVGNRVGTLSWFGGTPEYTGSNIDGGVIYKIYVSGQHRRKGVATAMLTQARSLHPDMDIRHTNALSEHGAAFAAATPTPNDLPGAPARPRGAARPIDAR